VSYAGRRYMYMQLYDTSVNANSGSLTVDVLNGVITSSFANGAATIVSQGIIPVSDGVLPGWYRVWLSVLLTSAVDTTTTARLYTMNDSLQTGYVGTGVGFYLYAPQVQVGSLTSYISNEPSSPMLPPVGSPQISSRQTD